MAAHSPETDNKPDGTAAAAGPGDVTVVTTETVERGPELRKSDLVDRVVAATGASKPDVRKVVEATLAELGQSLGKGETLQLPPMGRVKVQKRKQIAGGEVLHLRLRVPGEAAVKARRAKAELAKENPQ